MAKITKSKRGTDGRETVVVRTQPINKPQGSQGFTWWKAKTKTELKQQVIDTAAYLKENQLYRYRQASIHAKLYGNMPIGTIVGQAGNQSALGAQSTASRLPADRPTMNVVQSCVDTLVSRLTQSKPRPMFLTDNGNYKMRNLAKQMNAFTAGEFYQCKAYELGETALRVASVLGDGVVHVYETDDKRVGLETVLPTELYVDANDAFYGKPRSMYRLKLVDRDVVAQLFPEERSKIAQADQAYPDDTGESQRTMSDQIMLVEAWHLRSSKEATDGRHVIVCTSGVILDEDYEDDDFPFEFMSYSPRLVGKWAQGLAEQLTGTQVEINKLLATISSSINLVGVPRVFVEMGSKVVKAHLNNQVGAIVTYSGTKPEYEVAPCVPAELYAQLQRLIDYAYQQSGISALAATSQKPAGLNSGEALRNYDDLQSDRFATLSKRYDNFYIGLAYKVIALARKIAERDGKYQTVYPDKDGTRQIDLPEAKMLDNPFVIQCFDSSSLPRDPAGRFQKVTEMMQAGLVSPEEGRRMLSFPDLEQDDKLATAGKERILKILDDVVESGESGYEPPDPFMDPMMAIDLSTKYYNLYAAAKLEEKKLELIRTFRDQALSLQQAAMPPPPMDPAGATGVPGAPPTAELATTAPGAVA